MEGFRLFRIIVKFVLRLFFRVEIRGWENWECAGGGVLIAPNYVSFIDPLILAVFLPEKVPFAIERRLTKKRFTRFCLPLAETHILDADSPSTLKYFLMLLKNGGRCVIFPELQPTTTGLPMKLSAGVAMIADHTGAKILPIHIEGTEYTHFSRVPNKKRMMLLTKVVITVLPAETLEIPDGLTGTRRSAAAARCFERVMHRMCLSARTKQKPFFDNLIDARDKFGGNYRMYCDYGQKPITFNGFITRVLLISEALARQDIRGKHAGVLLPTSVGGIVSVYALERIGVIPAMLNFSLGERSMINCCRSACIETIVTSKKFIGLGKLEALIDSAVNAGINIIWLEDLAPGITTGKKLSAAFRAKFIQSNPVIPGEADKPAIILFTSGSEGAPKGVVLSYKNINVNNAQAYTRVDFYQADRLLNAMPIFHSFGLCAGMFLPVSLGIITHLYPSPLHYKTISTICYDERITILFATDTFLGGYAKAASDNYDFSNIRLLVEGGEKLRAQTEDIWFKRFGIRITEGYGVTEASPIVANNYYAHYKSGTVGHFVEGLEYRLEPVEGIHEGGRLWLKGPNIMLGYMRMGNPGEIEPLPDGWYDTGDIVKLDEDGFVTILGRAKRFAKIGGEMISLAAVEEVVNECWPDYTNAIVLLHGGPRVETLSLVTTMESMRRDELRQGLVQMGVADIAVPKKVVYMEDLPLLATGKVNYVRLEEILKERELDFDATETGEVEAQR